MCGWWAGVDSDGGKNGTVMLVVVDKRCSVDWQEPEGPIRTVNISLHSAVDSVNVMTDDGRNISHSSPSVQIRLKAAGAAVLVLHGNGVVALARSLRKWRFDPASASLAQAANTQMQYCTPINTWNCHLFSNILPCVLTTAAS